MGNIFFLPNLAADTRARLTSFSQQTRLLSKNNSALLFAPFRLGN